MAVVVAVGAGTSSVKTVAASVGVNVTGKVEEPPAEKNGPVIPAVAPAEDEVFRFAFDAILVRRFTFVLDCLRLLLVIVLRLMLLVLLMLVLLV